MMKNNTREQSEKFGKRSYGVHIKRPFSLSLVVFRCVRVHMCTLHISDWHLIGERWRSEMYKETLTHTWKKIDEDRPTIISCCCCCSAYMGFKNRMAFENWNARTVSVEFGQLLLLHSLLHATFVSCFVKDKWQSFHGISKAIRTENKVERKRQKWEWKEMRNWKKIKEKIYTKKKVNGKKPQCDRV